MTAAPGRRAAPGDARNGREEVDANGWTPWSGGPCPVAPNTPVQIRLRLETGFDEAQPGRPAGFWRWSHGRHSHRADITHYRVVPPA